MHDSFISVVCRNFRSCCAEAALNISSHAKSAALTTQAGTIVKAMLAAGHLQCDLAGLRRQKGFLVVVAVYTIESYWVAACFNFVASHVLHNGFVLEIVRQSLHL